MPETASHDVHVAQRRVQGHFAVLHSDPIILCAPEWECFTPASAVWSVLEALPEQSSHLFVYPSWFVDEERSASLAARLDDLTRNLPRLTVTFGCATAGETAELQRRGLDAIHCAGAAFAREDIYVPTPARRRRFDAIYDARLTDYKRHQLARSVSSLALIAAPSVPPRVRTRRYALGAAVALRHATWLVSPWPWSRVRWMDDREVAAAYGEARVGLCLSAVEGFMFASIQYLLAGLPVVTTHNLGGRDEFFRAPHVRWVDDDARAVAAAVDELVALDLDPNTIREATLVAVADHRRRFQAWIRSTIQSAGGEPGRWSDGWPSGLPDKFRRPPVQSDAALAEIAASLSGLDPGREFQ